MRIEARTPGAEGLDPLDLDAEIGPGRRDFGDEPPDARRPAVCAFNRRNRRV
jgi:hypothetical protein